MDLCMLCRRVTPVVGAIDGGVGGIGVGGAPLRAGAIKQYTQPRRLVLAPPTGQRRLIQSHRARGNMTALPYGGRGDNSWHCGDGCCTLSGAEPSLKINETGE